MTTVGTPPDRTAPSPPAEAGRKRPRNEGGDLCAASAKSGRGGGENEGPENEGPENGPGAGQGQGQGQQTQQFDNNNNPTYSVQL